MPILTLKLWRVLLHPSEDHPLFQRIRAGASLNIRWYLWLMLLIFSPLVFGALFVFTGTVYGLLWMVNIINAVSRERESGRYDLIATAPDGEAGVIWQVCSGTIHRSGRFRRLYGLDMWLSRMGMGVFLIVAFFSDAYPVIDDADVITLRIAPFVLITLTLLIDHLHAVVTACLMAMLAPEWAGDALSAGLVGVGAFLTLQISSYAVMILALILLPSSDPQTALGVMLVVPLCFAIVHEGVVLMLWRRFKARYAPDGLLAF